MSEPRLEDDIALGLDEICEDCDSGTDQPCPECASSDFDTLEEKHGE